VVDPVQGKVIFSAPRLDQPEGIGFLNGIVYFGTYGSARIFQYDSEQPFSFENSSSGNPGLAYDIGNDQDRPFALTSGENKLFVGTIPDYGKLGGALAIYDEEAGSWKEYPNVVENQSITGLACQNGLLYGGTSVAGGLGIPSSADEAKIFVWDIAQQKKIKEVSISIPGLSATYEGKTRTTPVMIGAMSFGRDGLLWVAVDGALAGLDPDTLQVVKYKVLATMDYDSDSPWRPFYLRWGADGLLYTTIGRKVTAFNTETMGYDTLTGYASLATLGDDGNLYYASGSKLMMAPLTRQIAPEDYTRGAAVLAAENAIDQLPGSYRISLEDKSEIQSAKKLVNAAVTAGAAENAIRNLEKLQDCETALEELMHYELTVQTPSINFGTYASAADAAAGTPASVTLKNTGNQPITLKLPQSKYYQITGTLPAELLPGETVVLQIRPKENLEAGKYEETVTVLGDHDVQAAISLCVTVDPGRGSQPGKNGNSQNSPQTGAASDNAIWIGLLALSFGTVFEVLRIKKEKRESE